MKRTHGLTRVNGKKTSEYSAWTALKQRCLNTKDKAYPAYGGRGITVSEDWVNSFENFYRDMGPKPNASLSLDRIDNDKGYSAENCRWADKATQTKNRRCLRQRKKSRIDLARIQALIFLAEEGYSTREIAGAIRLGKTRVHKLIVGFGLHESGAG